MNKKIIAIIVVVIAILILGFVFYTQNTVKVGDVYFAVPDGYHVVDEADYVNITSGSNYMCLHKHLSDKNINESIKDFVKYKKKGNDTLKFSKFTSGDITITKSLSSKDPKIFHYWFEKDGKTYHAFTWAGNQNSDSFMTNLVSSMKPAI